MTRGEGTTFALRLSGGIGCGAGISAALIALDAGDSDALSIAGRIIAIGVLACLVPEATSDERGRENGPDRSRRRGKPR